MPSATVKSHGRPSRAVLPELHRTTPHGEECDEVAVFKWIEDYSEFLICLGGRTLHRGAGLSVCEQRNAALVRTVLGERRGRSSWWNFSDVTHWQNQEAVSGGVRCPSLLPLWSVVP